MTLPALGPADAATRREAHRVGAHVMARARHAITGRIDLAPTPGGFGTLAFGPDHRVLRLDGPTFIDESTGDDPSTTEMSIRGATLRQLADFARVQLDDEFSVGHETPPLGDVDEPLDIEGDAIRHLGEWYVFGVEVVDLVLASLPESSAPTRARIWPEHFDLGIAVGTAADVRVNLGASPGDTFDPAPYLYVGPHNDDRPGEGDYWNAPFGAVLAYEHLVAAANPRAVGAAFMMEGISRFA